MRVGVIGRGYGERVLAKSPRAVVVIDALPRNPSPKVLKRELRAGA